MLIIPFVIATILCDGVYTALVPTYVSNMLVGKTTGQLELQIANSLPFSYDSYNLILAIIYGLLVAPAMIQAGYICIRYILYMKPTVTETISGYLARISSAPVKQALQRSFYVATILIFVAVPTYSGLHTYRNIGLAQATQNAQFTPLSDKAVGVFYYYWWHNSTFDPNIQSDNWLPAQLTPE